MQQQRHATQPHDNFMRLIAFWEPRIVRRVSSFTPYFDELLLSLAAKYGV